MLTLDNCKLTIRENGRTFIFDKFPVTQLKLDLQNCKKLNIETLRLVGHHFSFYYFFDNRFSINDRLNLCNTLKI